MLNLEPAIPYIWYCSELPYHSAFQCRTSINSMSSVFEKPKPEEESAKEKQVPAARTAPDGALFSGPPGVEGAAKEFVEENKAKGEPLVKECESPPAAQSDEDRAVFSPAIEVDEPDGKGSIVIAPYDWRVETLDNGTRLSTIHDGTVLHKIRPRLDIPGATMV